MMLSIAQCTGVQLGLLTSCVAGLQVEDSAAATMIEVAEPLAAALSLFRLLLLRAVANRDSQLTAMLAPYELSVRVRDVSVAASAAFPECGPIAKRATSGAVPLNPERDSTVNAQRALERLLDVAMRVDELCQQLGV